MFYSHVRVLGLLCITAPVPGSAIGWGSQSYVFPCKELYAELVGLHLEVLHKFNFIMSWFVRKTQWTFTITISCVEITNHAVLKGYIARSAALNMWLDGYNLIGAEAWLSVINICILYVGDWFRKDLIIIVVLGHKVILISFNWYCRKVPSSVGV